MASAPTSPMPAPSSPPPRGLAVPCPRPQDVGRPAGRPRSPAEPAVVGLRWNGGNSRGMCSHRKGGRTKPRTTPCKRAPEIRPVQVYRPAKAIIESRREWRGSEWTRRTRRPARAIFTTRAKPHHGRRPEPGFGSEPVTLKGRDRRHPCCTQDRMQTEPSRGGS
jgi:hypothetical protein